MSSAFCISQSIISLAFFFKGGAISFLGLPLFFSLLEEEGVEEVAAEGVRGGVGMGG